MDITEVEPSDSSAEPTVEETGVPQPLESKAQEKTVEIKLDVIDSQKVVEIQNILTPEVLSENRKHAHGMNVLGEGSVGYDYISDEQSAGLLKDPKQTLANFRQELQLDEKYIKEIPVEHAVDIIKMEIEKRNSQSAEKRRAETEMLSELGVDGSVKIHMCKGSFDSRHLDITSVSPKQEEAFTYVRKEIEKGIRVQIALGPGIAEYQNESGGTVKNMTTFINPETKVLEEGQTNFHIPSHKDELEKWGKYCQFVASKCPNAEFDVWVEPNHNLDDNGHGKFKHNADSGRHGEFSSEGRKPEEYALAVIMASYAVKQESPNSKIGINVAFADVDYIEKTLEAIRKCGYDPTKVVDYISFNPYRFGKKPELCGPKWNETLEGFRGDSAPKGRFDWGVEGSYEGEVLSLMKKVSSLGIKDIRTSESGYPAGELTRQQQAEYNLRGWLLDRYLGLPASPWTLTSESEDFSFIDKFGKKTKTYFAYKNFNSIFSSSVVPKGEIKVGDENIICKVFEDESDKSQILVFWSPTDYYSDNKDENLPINISSVLAKDTEVEVITQLTRAVPSNKKYISQQLQFQVSGEPIIVRIKNQSIVPPK
ncbi:hypothetical protein M0R04_02525 [Candidatus Dojkabacteria bacterium]|jgi:hypothetical protein|nr:hypothetical protein [Candidatus Dojkabacteria bacterium]